MGVWSFLKENRFKIIGLIILFFILRKIWRYIRSRLALKHYLRVCEEKIRYRDHQANDFFAKHKEEFDKYATAITGDLLQSILNGSVTDLKHLLESGKVTSKQLVWVFAKRCLDIGIPHKMVADVNFAAAYKRAEDCDNLRKISPENCKGLLFGVPVSIKECIEMKDLDATSGMACMAFNFKKEDGLLVRLWTSEGAIPFVTSNVPQLLMTMESMNRIYGRAENPWDFTRTPGGSSGGEGALVAARCSPLGMGSDIGGSIRIPAAFCGVYGLKPTVARMTTDGMASMIPNTPENNSYIPPVAGPLARSVEDLAIAMRCLLNNPIVQEEDPYTPFTPFKEELYTKKAKLRIGYMMGVDFHPIAPTHTRAIHETVKALEKLGHECIEVKIPDFEELVWVYFGIMVADNLEFYTKALKDEPVMDEYFEMELNTYIPSKLRPVVAGVLKLIGEKRAAGVVKSGNEKSAYELWDWGARQKRAQEKFQLFWRQNRLDTMIAPPPALPAVKHSGSQELFLTCVYTFIWNVLGNPVGSVPITRVREDEQTFTDKWNDKMTKAAQKDIQNSAGMPVGIQVVGQLYQDEMVLNVMKQIEGQIKFSGYPL